MAPSKPSSTSTEERKQAELRAFKIKTECLKLTLKGLKNMLDVEKQKLRQEKGEVEGLARERGLVLLEPVRLQEDMVPRKEPFMMSVTSEDNYMDGSKPTRQPLRVTDSCPAEVIKEDVNWGQGDAYKSSVDSSYACSMGAGWDNSYARCMGAGWDNSYDRSMGAGWDNSYDRSMGAGWDNSYDRSMGAGWDNSYDRSMGAGWDNSYARSMGAGWTPQEGANLLTVTPSRENWPPDDAPGQACGEQLVPERVFRSGYLDETLYRIQLVNNPVLDFTTDFNVTNMISGDNLEAACQPSQHLDALMKEVDRITQAIDELDIQ